MSEYREAPSPDPLVLAMGEFVYVVEPDTGKLFWKQRFSRVVNLVFPVDRCLFVVAGVIVHCFHLRSGAHEGQCNVGFMPTAGIAKKGQLYLAGDDGAACLGPDGQIRWKLGVELDATTFTNRAMVCRGGGQELWREGAGWQPAGVNAGVALGPLVAQPDLR